MRLIHHLTDKLIVYVAVCSLLLGAGVGSVLTYAAVHPGPPALRCYDAPRPGIAAALDCWKK